MATTTKKPTAAELARRESQSAKDKGEAVTVTVSGIHVTLDVNDLDDYDIVAALSQGNPQPALQLFLPDENDRQAALDSLRDENGKLKLTTVVEWIGDVYKAAGQGNS